MVGIYVVLLSWRLVHHTSKWPLFFSFLWYCATLEDYINWAYLVYYGYVTPQTSQTKIGPNLTGSGSWPGRIWKLGFDKTEPEKDVRGDVVYSWAGMHGNAVQRHPPLRPNVPSTTPSHYYILRRPFLLIYCFGPSSFLNKKKKKKKLCI